MPQYPIDEIKDRITVLEYARRHLGLKIDRPGARCVSFRPGASNKSSLLIEERHWYDFGSGVQMGGDVIDLVMAAKNLTWHEAFHELAALTGVKVEGAAGGNGYRDLGPAADEFHGALTAEDRAYLQSRRITDDTITRLKLGRGTRLGLEGRLVIPYWKAGRVAYLVGRGDEPKYKKLYRNNESDHPIWGVDTLHREGPVVIAEGIFDAISCWQEGYAVLTAVTGRFSAEQMKDLWGMLRGRSVKVCMDYDPKTKAGQKFALDLAQKLLDRGIHADIVELKGDGEKVDLSSLYAGGATIDSILSNFRPFMHIAVDAIEGDEDKLAKLLKQAARWMPWPELAKVVEHVRELGKWNGAWLRAIVDELRRPPSDHSIVNELAAAHKLIYHEQLGWFEYDAGRGVWAGLADTEIQQQIAELLRHHRTGNRISSAFKTAKAQFIRQSPLNTSPMLNVRNGMLDPETRELKAHDAGYYSTIQLGYNFDPHALCPAWTQFIEDVTDGDERRMMFLQEMFGYCLTNDTRYQVAFFMIGTGANGKSVLLDVLQAMVGAENVSNVEVSSLSEPFQRISLHGKLVNVACETESNVTGTEQIFKQVVAGDPINGCFKGKDFITFKPFCKCVFAANQYSESSDLTKGFMRRIRFLRFPVEFVDSPTLKQHRKRDNRIAAALMDELPGILNWALIGLEALRENDGFTQTLDNSQMHQEYLEYNDSLELWWQDYTKPGYWISRSAVYQEYKDWSDKNNSRPLGTKRFWPKLRDKTALEERTYGGAREVFFVPEKK